MSQHTFSKTALTAALFTVFTSAYAEDVVELETVKITAPSGSMNKLGEVPFRQAKSAVAISAETLKAEGVEKADELGRYQAGFNNQVFGSDTNTNWFRMRGTQATQAINGTPAAQYGFFSPYIETFGIEAVEVTKGADSITFGAAEAGGLINYISKRAHKNQVGKGEIRAHIGNAKQYGIGADYTGAFNSDQSLRYRVVGSIRTADGDWDDTDNRTIYVAPTLQWDITPQTRLDLLASYQHDKGTPSSNFLPQEGTLVAFPDGSRISRHNNYGDPVNDTETNKQWSLGYELNHDFGKGLLFTSNYRYSHTDNFHRGSYIYSYLVSSVSPNLSRDVVFNDGTAKSHSFDNRLTWKFKNNWLDNTLVGGINYNNYKVDALYGNMLFPNTTPAVNVFDPKSGWGKHQDISGATQRHIKSNQLGFYLQNQSRINKLVSIGLGIRHDRAEQEEYTRAQKVKINHTSYAASLMYHAPAGFNPYISYSESFKLPTGLSGNDVLYEPITTKQTEIGVKYMPTWFDGNISLAAFRAKDKGALMSQDRGATINNPDKMLRKGVELQIDGNISENWRAGLSYTYLSSVSKTPTGDVRQPWVPKHSVSLKTAYRFNEGKLNGLTLGAGLRHIGESVPQKGSLYDNVTVPSATLVDLMASYQFANRWSVQLNVDNVGNHRYISGCDYSCYYGQGRRINASVSYTF